ncbi:MAG TPA: L,D-transpeptidase [Anaerolineae bacterium]|nr:L,D-transpeptidase [Anaerolineae bacterium]HOQ97387.1 L,D-transpeptidase [Anaerolineae bacterium]HPL30174.1 L,D-transpeptidase [Anaerolineae bacterium]
MLRLRIRPEWALRGAIVLGALAVAGTVLLAIAALRPELFAADAAWFVADLLAPPHSVADLLASPPGAGKTVDVDAYLSPAGTLRCTGAGSVILADRPFSRELAVLGSTQANPLLDDAPWLALASGPGVPAAADLPYHARVRGRLTEPAASDGCSPGTPVFLVESVLRTYVQDPAKVVAAAGAAPAAWPRHHDVEMSCSVPLPPGWRVEHAGDGSLSLSALEWPASAITVRVYPGETHHDPYEPDSLPALLVAQSWSVLAQSTVLGPDATTQGLYGYRIDREEGPAERSVAVLFSGHGYTYELGVHYPLGFAASQPLLDVFSAVVAGFGLNAPLTPSPTPPVRQALGRGPFLSEEDAVKAACGCLRQEIDAVVAQQLVPEAEARRLGTPCATFRGHNDAIWAITVETPLAERTGNLRLLIDAATGRELCREEITPEQAAAQAAVVATAGTAQVKFVSSRPKRWIEVNLSQQMLIAWEGDTPMRRILVSTGTDLHPTVTGRFYVYYKTRTMDMRGPDYFIPGVPWVMLFYEGYALHGAWWHWSFGQRVSHGCVNMTIPESEWLYEWASPVLPEGEYAAWATPCNPGTPVIVHY